MLNYAILIDGGFVKRRLATFEKPLSASDVSRLVEAIASHTVLKHKLLYRTYFYDAPPLSKTVNVPLQGGKLNLGDTQLAKHNNQLHKELTNQDCFSLRMGEVQFRKNWQLDRATLDTNKDKLEITAKDLKPNIQKKGVDMRIGLDIASLVLKKQVSLIVLVTGDSDFVPPMKFARREGAQFAIAALGHRIHQDLIEHTDYSLQLDI